MEERFKKIEDAIDILMKERDVRRAKETYEYDETEAEEKLWPIITDGFYNDTRKFLLAFHKSNHPCNPMRCYIDTVQMEQTVCCGSLIETTTSYDFSIDKMTEIINEREFPQVYIRFTSPWFDAEYTLYRDNSYMMKANDYIELANRLNNIFEGVLC